MNQKIEIKTKIPLQSVIWILKVMMILLFFSFSFFPLTTASFTLLFQHYSGNLRFQIITIGIILSLGLLTLFGIIKSNMQIRFIGVGFFSLGIIFVFNNPYILTLGIIVSWAFYEIWYLLFLYDQFVKDYSTYPNDSLEIQKLNITFRNQFISFGVLVWIALSISWLSIFISSSYYIELGHQFGTLGISISIAMITIFYLINKLYLTPFRRKKISRI